MDPQLAAQLRQIVAYSLSAGTVDVYGQIQVGVSTATVYARIEPRTRGVDRDDGTFVRTSHYICVDSVAGFTPSLEMNLWLPQDSGATLALARNPKVVHPCFDERGILDHWEILV